MPRFSSTLMEHARYPSNQGVLENATHFGKASLNGNPPFITLYLVVSDFKIEQAKFQAGGCGVTTAVCSATTELITGLTLEECKAIEKEAICDELEGVPPDKMHCIHVVLKALAVALDEGRIE